MDKIISQEDLFPNLVKLHGCYDSICYPIGSYLPSVLNYTESAAKKLAQLFFRDNIAFIVRGTSGAMIGSLMARYLIDNAKVCAKVIINRKPNEISHADNLECIEGVLNYEGDNPFRIVIADDFMSSGETIYNIVNAVESYIEGSFIFDALVIHNKFICDEYVEDIGRPGDLILPKECTIVEEVLQTKFLNILCL